MKRLHRKWTALLLGLAMLASMLVVPVASAEAGEGQRFQLVLTLAADITSAQKAEILRYFGISEDQAKVITITNADEHAQLGNLLPASVIGNKTLSCALIRLTTSGGIQVKTANMNYVTSNMIASTLSTSGVYNCEVLTAAPFSVSGTGALTGVMMAYEAGTGTPLDAEKKSLANEELVITGEISKDVGQDQATLVVNDIKIHIVRDGVTDQQQVVQVVDEVIATTELAAAQAASASGKAAPKKLGTVQTEKLYDFGYKFSQMGYSYADMQPTLERVTRNITKSTGIQDPITDTFTYDDSDGLPIDSILLNTEDGVMGRDANINATNTVALGDHPAEVIEVITGDVRLTESGRIKADRFINGSNLVAFKDINGMYALMDLNGNKLTESVFSDDFRCYEGRISARLAGDDGLKGILSSDGTELVPFRYPVVEVLGNLWGAGITLAPGTDEDYDYYGFGGGKYVIDKLDLYYFGGENNAPVATLTRDQWADGYAVGDYLNVRDRSGAVATYDSAMQVVQHPDSLYDSSYDEAHRAAEILSTQMKASVSRFRGSYAIIYKDGKNGVVDRYGNLIVPIAYDSIITDSDDMIVSGGYICAEQDDSMLYVLQDGVVSAQYDVDRSSVYNYGMAAYVKDDSGVYTLYSGDGVSTVLDSKYDYLYALPASRGMLWKAQLPDYSCDLIDWHGNVLLTGCDEYSISANGNYLIAQDGYTSSMLYQVNDASPVAIAETAGGAAELVADVREGASLEVYTGEPTLQRIGVTAATGFISGTNLMKSRDEDTGLYALFDMSGRQLTNPVYDYSFEAKAGWLVVREVRDGQAHCGLLNADGAQALPCEYDYIKVLNEQWVVAYHLKTGGTESDYDFRDWSSDDYYLIDTATVCHLTDSEVSSVQLTRDQIADIDACEGYINVQDRTSGAVTTYDSTFTAVATVSYTSTFTGFSTTEVLRKTIEDKTGYSVYDEQFPDGYSRVSDWRGETTKMGVVDMNGEIVVPVEFEEVQSTYGTFPHIAVRGYFCVEKDGKFGYVTKGGEVTCEIAQPTDYYSNEGMAASVREEDGTYTLVAADGTITKGFENLYSFSDPGMFWRANSKSSAYGTALIDWHGNVLFDDYYDADVSDDGRFILVQQNWEDPYVLYGVDGAMPEGGFAGADAAQPEAAEPEAVQPEAAQPEAAEPEAAQPEAAQPEVAEPEAAEPEVVQPEAAQPEVAEPEAVEFGAAQPEVVQPEAAQTDAGYDAESVKALLASAKNLMDIDMTANQGAITTLIDQARGMIEAANPNAAALLTSAITLLSGGAADATAVTTLIDTAVGML